MNNIFGGAIPFLALVMSKTSQDRYEVDYLVHGIVGDVYSGHRLSHYDGMPIGGRIWILADEVTVVKERGKS